MTVITFVDFSESTAATIDMPVGIAAGDIAVLHDVAGDVVSPASVYPSGFTAIGTSQTDTSGGIFVRLNVSYKILSGSETTITGMSAGALATYKTLTVYRKTGSYSWNAPASVGAELLVAGGVASKSVVVGTAPLVVIGACWGSSGTLSLSPSADAAVGAEGQVGYKIYDSSPSNNTVSTSNLAGTLAISAFYISASPPSDGTATGTSTVTGAGVAFKTGAGAATGTATVAAIGASTASVTGIADGTSDVLGIGLSTARTDGTSAVASAALARGVRLSLNGDNRAAQIVRQHGRTMVLRRASEGTVIALVGKPVSSSVAAVDLTGSARQQMLRIKIGPTEIEGSSWTSPAPARDDIIDLGGRTRAVKNVRPIRHNGRVQLYELTLAG